MEIDLPSRYGPLKGRLPIPPGAMRLPEFVHNLFPLEDRLVGMGVRSAQQEGRTVSCRSGCGACCRQPVPVSLPEAFLLYEIVASQPPEQRECTLARFEAVKEALQANGFGDRSILAEQAVEGAVAGLALDYFQLGLPCPFLESESCSIHSFRPTSCREHLVTSPAELCAAPAERNGMDIRYNIGLRSVLAPVSMTQALAMLYAELEGEEPVLLPLTLALDRAAEMREARARKHDSQKLFSSFFAILDPLLRSRI
jgi:Fe-S-cluster containining protein